MTRTKTLVNNLLMSMILWKGNLEHKLRTFRIVILNIKWRGCKSRKNLCTKNFPYVKKFYVYEIAAINLSKIDFLKNAKKICKPNNHDLNRDWISRKNAFFNNLTKLLLESLWKNYLFFNTNFQSWHQYLQY